MLQTYEAVLQPNGSLHFLENPPLAATKPCRVLVTFTGSEGNTTAAPGDWKQFVGSLKNSPNLNGDPLAIQQAMRHEWE